MKIDITPTLDEANLTITVSENIDSTEEVSIMINGLMGLVSEDIQDITDNIITLKENFNLDWINDSFEIIYTAI